MSGWLTWVACGPSVILPLLEKLLLLSARVRDCLGFVVPVTSGRPAEIALRATGLDSSTVRQLPLVINWNVSSDMPTLEGPSIRCTSVYQEVKEQHQRKKTHFRYKTWLEQLHPYELYT